MHPEMIEAFMHSCIVRTQSDCAGACVFDPEGIERLSQIERMRRNRRPVLRNIRRIFILTDKLAETERELSCLKARLSA